jgi:pimeloyl-ACP methyl ester carboxylesterase
MHNAGHMAFGPAEAFTPEQLAELYDVNVLSTQRVNRAAQPIVFSHGWPLSADDWDTQMLFFLKHGYRVIRFPAD